MRPTAQSIEFLTFNVNGTICGMNILDIQEMSKVSDITTAPQAPDYIEGIINLRGNIVTIVNLGKKLGLRPVKRKNENRIIILISENEYIGLMIDDFNTVIQSNITDIGPVPPNLDGFQGRFYKGVLQTEDQLVAILKTNMVLSA